MSELTDEELMAHILAGDRSALAPLVERHHRPLFAYFYRLGNGDRTLADDLVQDTFVRILEQRTYQPNRKPRARRGPQTPDLFRWNAAAGGHCPGAAE